MDLTTLTATAAGQLIADNELSSVELTQACLDRIAERNEDVGAFRHLNPKFSLSEAARADRETPRSPLHGVPFAIKDVIDTKDFPTEYGTPIHRGHQPIEDAACISLMRRAGAVILGKVVSTEYAIYNPAETRHPMNLDHTPGGSSSGTAASVCDRMVPIAFGNQTAGSLIRPAAFCGVYGLKPTHGTTDGSGILPLQPYFDTLGYMARSIEDIQAFYGVVSEQNQSLLWPADKRPKIGLCKTSQWSFAESETRSVLIQAAAKFEEQRAVVEEFELPSDYADLPDVHRRVLYAGVAKSLEKDYRDAKDYMSDILLEIIEEGLSTSSKEYDEAFAFADQCRQSVNERFYDFDAIICPSAPGEAPKGMATGNPIFQVTWTLLGVPCLNLPVGFGPSGLPVGIQLIGRRYDDKAILALGRYLMHELQPIRS
ncbi:MAG TPA: amidase [Gammaproteobacteria bacterium]|nr:amidase [Gammaproteobacteria bacterium]